MLLFPCRGHLGDSFLGYPLLFATVLRIQRGVLSLGLFPTSVAESVPNAHPSPTDEPIIRASPRLHYSALNWTTSGRFSRYMRLFFFFLSLCPVQYFAQEIVVKQACPFENLHCLSQLSFCLRGHKRKTCTLITVLSEKNLERMNLLFQDLL